MEDETVLQTRGFAVVQRKEADGHTWHYVRRKEGVAILALTDNDEVILIQQKRPVLSDVMIEIPAGGVESGNADLAAEAARELREETGFEAGRLEKILDIYPSPGYYTEKTHIFLATNLASGKQQLTDREKNNKLRVIKHPLSQVIQMVYRGEITDAKTVVALLFYTQKKLPDRGQQGAK